MPPTPRTDPVTPGNREKIAALLEVLIARQDEALRQVGDLRGTVGDLAAELRAANKIEREARERRDKLIAQGVAALSSRSAVAVALLVVLIAASVAGIDGAILRVVALAIPGGTP
jgi:hypothetical protein